MPFVRSLLQNLIRSYTISLSGVVVIGSSQVEVTINTIVPSRQGMFDDNRTGIISVTNTLQFSPQTPLTFLEFFRCYLLASVIGRYRCTIASSQRDYIITFSR